MKRRSFIAGAGAALVAGTASVAAGPPGPIDWARVHSSKGRLGLTAAGSVFGRDGAVYRAIGCNYDAVVNDPARAANVKIIKDMGAPFIRTNFGQYWAGRDDHSEWRLYLTDKKAWFGQLDAVVEACEAAGVGLVPSMFWRVRTLPDLMQFAYGKRDAIDQWGNPESNTRKMMRQITAETVDRYKNSPSVWGWEFGNEFFAVVGDPLKYGLDPGQAVLGSPPTYEMLVDQRMANGVSDILDYKAVFSAYDDWSHTVRAHDPNGRFLSSGDSVPDVNFSSAIKGLRSGPDTLAQWMKEVTTGRPAPVFQNPKSAFDVISVHVYQAANIPFWYFNDGKPYGGGAGGLIRLIKKIADDDNRPLFIGEFGSKMGANGQNGEHKTDGTLAGEHAYFQSMMDAITQSGVALAAVWDFKGVYSGHDWSVGPGSGREYQLQAIAAANDAYAKTDRALRG